MNVGSCCAAVLMERIQETEASARGQRRRYNALDSHDGGFAMSTLALALLIFVAVAACTFWIAGDLYGHGSPWARDVCGLSRTLCDHPLWGAFATAAAAILYLMMRGLRL
jgi:hypothetical protein